MSEIIKVSNARFEVNDNDDFFTHTELGVQRKCKFNKIKDYNLKQTDTYSYQEWACSYDASIILKNTDEEKYLENYYESGRKYYAPLTIEYIQFHNVANILRDKTFQYRLKFYENELLVNGIIYYGLHKIFRDGTLRVCKLLFWEKEINLFNCAKYGRILLASEILKRGNVTYGTSSLEERPNDLYISKAKYKDEMKCDLKFPISNNFDVIMKIINNLIQKKYA